MYRYLLVWLIPLAGSAQQLTDKQIQRWEQQAARVTIIRDQWGIPHIYGKSDADAVFGLLYAQCEDDFQRVEFNYIEKLGRMAEIKGKPALYEDLLIRMIIDSSEAIKEFQQSPAWLQKLCRAFADGINYYLYKHPETRPALLHHFEPWYPLLWTDGSIGAINTADITAAELASFYGREANAQAWLKPDAERQDRALTGSNGFAFSPKVTQNGNAILYINPHVTFYFRPEVHMVSEEGLNAYGAVTWGQFFIYQGFNAFCGWMHTSSYVDAADTYIETIFQKSGSWFYRYDHKDRPIKERPVHIRIKEGTELTERSFNTWSTHHGPVMAYRNGQYLSLRADNRITNGLIQCWQRTKVTSFEAFQRTLDLRGNISNNTVYADAAGNIGYWHGNRIPVRDTTYDWSKAVDGSTPNTEWKGLHPVRETVHCINPENGWLQNCNATPFAVAGTYSPNRNAYPKYMAPDGENFRGLQAVRVLSREKAYTLDQVIAAGYDNYLTAFEVLVPALVNAFDQAITPEDSLFAYLAGPVAVLRQWDFRSRENSIATTLAVEWGQRILPAIFRTTVVDDEEADQVAKTRHYAQTAPARELLEALLATITDLTIRFGRWQLPWGSINRFQRISPALDPHFDDLQESLPVGFVSSTWGMLPSYNSRTFPGTVKRYGVNGNSFVCAVEFGQKVQARSLLAGGESGDPQSPHFFDQGTLYAKGAFKPVAFYREEVLRNAAKTYHPGE